MAVGRRNRYLSAGHNAGVEDGVVNDDNFNNTSGLPTVSTSPASFLPESTNDNRYHEERLGSGIMKWFRKSSKSSRGIIPRGSVDSTSSVDDESPSDLGPGDGDDDDDDGDDDVDMPKPPDGGWGWVVVFASFMIHILADGFTYTFGNFFGQLESEFQIGKAAVSLVHSILTGVTLCSGPIASSLTNRYGCRSVTILGAAISTIGIGITALSPNIAFMYFSIGICTGLGFGLIYLPAIVSVSMYFEKKRAFATGIAVCGSGFGTFIMAPVTRWLIDTLHWDRAFLVLSAVTTLNALFGALFRPLPGSKGAAAVEAPPQEPAGDAGNEDKVATPVVQTPDQISYNCSFTSSADATNAAAAGLPEVKVNGEPLLPIALQLAVVPATFGRRAEPKQDGKYSEVARMALSYPVLPVQHQDAPAVVPFGSHSRIYENSDRLNNRQRGSRSHHASGNLIHPNSGVMFRKDILYGGSLYNIPEYKSNPRRYSRHQVVLQDEEKRALAEALDEGVRKGLKAEAVVCGCIPASAEASKAFKAMMDLSLLKDAVFIMFAVSNFLTSIGFYVPYVYTVNKATEQLKMSEDDASSLLSAIGIANTVGRIVLGYVSDRNWINRLYTYNICLAICGLSFFASNFCLDYTSQVVFCTVFGMTSGAYVGLTSVVLVDLLGLDKLTNAFGLLLLFQGVASVIGPPIIGWMWDGSYDTGFYAAGATIFLSGVMLFAIPCISRDTVDPRGDHEYAGGHGAVPQGDGSKQKRASSDKKDGRISEADEEDPDDAPMTMEAP